MRFTPENLGLQAAGLPLLRDLVHERTGLFYDNSRFDTLSDRLSPLVIERGFRSFLDFYYLLKYDEREAPAEWQRVIDALSVPETYFWREIDQIRGLACRLLPEIVKSAPQEPIRIWSVPCATGEEPLTIAMVLEETGWFGRAPIEIHASDASPAAIAKARTGAVSGTVVSRPSPRVTGEVLFQQWQRVHPPYRRCSSGSRRGAWSI